MGASPPPHTVGQRAGGGRGAQATPHEAVQDEEGIGDSQSWGGVRESGRLVLSKGCTGQAGLGLPLEEGVLSPGELFLQEIVQDGDVRGGEL